MSTSDGLPKYLRPKAVRTLLVLWWVGLALQIWFAWDLSEAFSRLLCLLVVPPEAVYGACCVLFIVLCVGRQWRRGWASLLALGATAVVALWISVTGVVYEAGTRLYLWRNKAQFLEDVASIRAGAAPTAVSSNVFVEGSPQRFAFERRWVGMFHWSAFVYDPDRTLGEGVRDAFGYSVIGSYELQEDWVLLTVMK